MDQTQDIGGRVLYRIQQLYQPPEYVKKASVDDLCGHIDNDGNRDVPLQAYGDPQRMLFPCHTAAATWVSMGFFAEKKANFKQFDAQSIEDRILHCAEIHGIRQQIEELRDKIASGEAFPEVVYGDDDYALIAGNERHYLMRNAEEVIKAADYVIKWRDQLPYEMRQQMADKVLNKAAKITMTLDHRHDDIQKLAGHGACLAKEACDMLIGRVQATIKGPGKLGEEQAAMQKLAETFQTNPSKLREPGVRCKLAAAVDAFDRRMGLANQYGPEFPRVEDVLFSITGEKMAAAVTEHCATVTGNIYKLADLDKLRVRDVADAMGSEMADAMTIDGIHVNSEKAAEIIPTLDRGFAQLFDNLMSTKLLSPVAKEASAQAQKINRQYLHDMAAQFHATQHNFAKC